MIINLMNFVLYVGYVYALMDEKYIFYFILVLVICMYVYHVYIGAYGGQRSALDTLHLEMTMSCPKRVLGTKLGSP